MIVYGFSKMSAHILVIALVWAISSAARYADYSGARMPYYHEDYESRDSLARDEYPERSPDAPVPLDYKYEETSSGKYDRPLENIVEENNEWPKTNKKNRPINIEENYIQDIDKYSIPEERGRKFKPSHLQIRNRPFKRKHFNIVDENSPQREHQRFINVKEQSRKNELHSWEERIQPNREFDTAIRNIDAQNILGLGKGVRRSGRRKVRDRANLPMGNEAMLMADRVFDTDESSDDETIPLDAGTKHAEAGRARATKSDTKFVSNPDKIILRNKNYPSYEEYYDMKTAFSRKNDLPPILLRRTKADLTTALSTRILDNWFRRVNIPDATVEAKQGVTSSASTLSISSSTKTNVKVATEKKAITSSSKIISSVTHNTSDLSLAEKSRLSILKKAQEKENLRSVTVTTKPPVLLQVTERMQTVVIVEPPGSQLQRLQAREISDNSPDRIARAKRLMRHKLLANAKNIHDLTDNWDDLVCDYIDVSLLSGATDLRSSLKIHKLLITSTQILISFLILWK